MTTRKRTCTIGITYKCDKLDYIKSVFQSENVMYLSQIFVRQSTYDDPKYISMPQLYEKDNQCYYYSIGIKRKGSKMKDIPVHILLVNQKDDEYGTYLRGLTQQYPYLWRVLCICMDYYKHKQQLKYPKKKIKHFTNGQKNGFRVVFKLDWARMTC
eukprot:192461_1